MPNLPRPFLPVLLIGLAAPATPQAVDVPLVLFRNPDFPAGFALGYSLAASFGDFDADGWTDLLAMKSGALWRNEGGRTWRFAADLRDDFLVGGGRYGASWGDFDLDGLPDLADEPRTLACIHLLRNLGDGEFRDYATLPQWVDDPACGGQAETNCWGDVDGDGDLDLFVPIYPPWTSIASIGNRFYTNAGASGTPPYHLEESTQSAGLENPPPDSARPEGAQMVDVDGDGDLDLYAGGTLFQNRSTVGAPRFEWLTESGSGIRFHDVTDEGAAFGDHDMDGDMDLFIAYFSGPPGVRIWENRGDGTFFFVGQGVIANPGQGLTLGLSIADWDNDGDLDFTTKEIFRRNMLIETGVRRYEIATHHIDPTHIDMASPSWADWDKDGDLDAVMGFDQDSYLYQNRLYDHSTPKHLRRFLRVKPIREHRGVRVESEYGAVGEVRVQGDTSGRRLVRLCSSSAGYVNQSEYTLHFALPPDPTPKRPNDDLTLDVSVDFPALPEQGQWRVDASVNPVLGDLDLASLDSRELFVLRDGRVEVDGVIWPPLANASPRLVSLAGELPAADVQGGLPDLAPPPTADHWVGLELDTTGAAHPLLLRELVLDAQLGAPIDCGGESGNVLVFELNGSSATLVPGGAFAFTSSPRNAREFHRTGALLEVDRRYRVVARVTLLRESAMTAPAVHDDVVLQGALDFPHPAACPDAAVAAATLRTDLRAFTVRVSRR